MDSVLYYPYLSPSPVWLRMAALSWDSVYILSSPRSQAYSQLPADLETGLPGFVRSIDVSQVAGKPSVLMCT
jgi:hypothetical protein